MTAKGLLRVLIVLLCLIAFTLPALAWDEPYDPYGNPQYRYKGFSGPRYQYNLSKPDDRIQELI